MGVVPCLAVEKWLHAFVFRLDISFILFCWLNKKKEGTGIKSAVLQSDPCEEFLRLIVGYEISGECHRAQNTHTQTRTHCYVSLVTAVSQQSVGALFQI